MVGAGGGGAPPSWPGLQPSWPGIQPSWPLHPSLFCCHSLAIYTTLGEFIDVTLAAAGAASQTRLQELMDVTLAFSCNSHTTFGNNIDFTEMFALLMFVMETSS